MVNNFSRTFNSEYEQDENDSKRESVRDRVGKISKNRSLQKKSDFESMIEEERIDKDKIAPKMGEAKQIQTDLILEDNRSNELMADKNDANEMKI